MNPIPRFNLGDSVFVKFKNRRIQGTIVPYINGVMVIHDGLNYAEEVDYRIYYQDNRANQHYTTDGKMYAKFDGENNVYLILLSSGENISMTEREILMMSGNEAATRTISNIHSKRGMNAFKQVQDDKLLSRVPYLTNGVNDHIQSYLTETPLSTNVNTRIHNRQNPLEPSRPVIYTLNDKQYDDEMYEERKSEREEKNAQKNRNIMNVIKREDEIADRVARDLQNVKNAKEAWDGWKKKKGGKTKKTKKTRKSKRGGKKKTRK